MLPHSLGNKHTMWLKIRIQNMMFNETLHRHTCTNIDRRTDTQIHLHTCTRIYMHIDTHNHVYVHTQIQTSTSSHIHEHTDKCNMHGYERTHEHTHSCTHAQKRRYRRVTPPHISTCCVGPTCMPPRLTCRAL